MMIVALNCSYGGEEVVGESIRKGENIYCSEACAFGAGRSGGYNHPADSTVAVPSAEFEGEEKGAQDAEGFSAVDISRGTLTNRTDMMRQHTPVVDASDSAKPGEPFAVVPKAEAIGEVDDPNAGRRACSGCLAFRLATSAMESIHRKERPEPYPVFLPRRRAPGAGIWWRRGYMASEKTGSEIFSC